MRNMRVIGHEGGPFSSIGWGTAVVERQGRLWNPLTGQTQPIEELGELVTEGMVTLLPVPIEVPDSDEPLLVLRTTSDPPGSIGAEGYHVLSPEKFDQYRRVRIGQILDEIQALPIPALADLPKGLVREAMTLDPRNAEVNAFRVWRSRSDRAERIARALVSEADREAFDRALQGWVERALRWDLQSEMDWEGVRPTARERVACDELVRELAGFSENPPLYVRNLLRVATLWGVLERPPDPTRSQIQPRGGHEPAPMIEPNVAWDPSAPLWGVRWGTAWMMISLAQEILGGEAVTQCAILKGNDPVLRRLLFATFYEMGRYGDPGRDA